MRDPVQRNVPTRPGGGGGDAAGSGKPAEQSGATGTMSIGEVLGILKPEFPDITVSRSASSRAPAWSSPTGPPPATASSPKTTSPASGSSSAPSATSTSPSA